MLDITSNLHLKPSGGGRLDLGNVLTFLRRFLETRGLAEVSDPAVEHDVVLFVYGGGGVSDWTSVQSPWADWDAILGAIAAAAEKQLAAQAAVTEVSGDELVTVAAYREGRPARAARNPKMGAALMKSLRRMGLPLVAETEDSPSMGQTVLRFRGQLKRPEPGDSTGRADRPPAEPKKSRHSALNLHLRRSDGGRLDKEHVLAFVRRFLETWSISNVGDPSADLDVELFACGGDDVSNWTTVQSPWGRWLGLVRDIAAAAEKELGAQAAQTMVIGNQVVDGAAYRNGRPDVNGFMPKERAAIVDLLKTLSLPVVPEMSELPPSTAAISRFRLPTAAPMSMTQAGPLAVPRALCGKRGNAATRWRRITRKVARAGTWKDVLSTLDFVDVRQTGGQLICWDRSSVYEENYWLCYTVGHNFWMDCVEAAGSRDGGTQRAIALVEEGLDWFWICLGLLAEQELWFPSELLFPRNPEQVPKDATVRQILRGIMKWWEPLCELNERTYDILRRKWKWQMAIRQMCEGMPVDQYSRLSDRQITPQAAGEIIRKWLDGPET